ncbi:putative 33 kDa inner dynein arm light chain, axonemal [Trypanosoma rangeli]|uniref:Putative 33 kDa inner dynein arm light chain, axonemal n=1 Tax=Trypanosoma rangeli TaxID=5698 RepID=A0A422MW64_TRYRA|nr:putative 33 kDa inner dynein arm light chain, axonemal [Trypanosoma rangeli]RNE97475.1 putative 33 kDa inner dynein arm light chain, axonemal [Trypanosoma rangeli]|eukprot:RNE97475.1 putative 33 kDa inner dynein arm light chain, axonemal [Trypanosoma rangeli]
MEEGGGRCTPSLSGSLLKLQRKVLVDTVSVDGAEPLRRSISIPASRLADARENAANDLLNVGRVNRALVTNPSFPAHVARVDEVPKISTCSAQSFAVAAPFPNETALPWRMRASLPVTSSPAAEKAARMDEVNTSSVAYPGGAVLPALMTKLSDVERILYTLLPPRRTVCKETGNTFMEFVSTEPSSRIEVAELHEQLVNLLKQRRARDSGICPIRREIYAEVFDELIRQVTLEEPTRGILLLRVRDELYQTLAAHRSLVERAMYFASKQREESDEGVAQLKQRIKELEEVRLELLMKRKAAQMRENQLLHTIEQENNARSKVQQDELGYFRRSNRQLAQRIKTETERTNAQGVVIPAVLLDGEVTQIKPPVTT